MPNLAINGGNKVRKEYFPAYNTIGEEEKSAAIRVMDSGCLSKFLGSWSEDFYGGKEVIRLENNWAKYFGVRHAIAVNSATSGLYCAVGAVGVSPGDEVLVSPYTMSASATAPIIYGGVPVFADIEEEYFCLDPINVEEKITERTKAIIVVDIFGQPYDRDKINEIAKKYGIYVIEDAAQAPGAQYKEKFAGTLGDVGVFSLNYHKHIHCGEGGIVVTNDDEIAERVRLIRNHAESVVEGKKYSNLVNMVGFNYRMTELEAAIANEQLSKLDSLLEERIRNVQYIAGGLSDIPCLEVAKVRNSCKHAFYVQPIKYNKAVAGVDREIFVEAVKEELMPSKLREDEGVTIGCGYVKPLYLLPMYQQKIAFGTTSYPFKGNSYGSELRYNKGLCPVCESMFYQKLFTHELMRPGMLKLDLDDVIEAFQKVWKYRGELKNG